MNLNTGVRLARLQSKVLTQGHGSTTAAFTTPIIPLLFSASNQPGARSYRLRIASTSTTTTISRTPSFRTASTSTQTKEPQPDPSSDREPPTPNPSAPIPATQTLNPPATTRPPPLDLPVRDPSKALVTHLFHLGRAYTTFYKNGLKAVLTNRALASRVAPPPHLPAADTAPTRSDVLLRARVRHDLSRLPVFGVLVLACGEFTPLIVLAFPRLTPYTCRIPKQIDVIRRTAEERRAQSFRALAHVTDEEGLRALADGHVCRVLGLTSRLWDKAGLDGPFAKSRAGRAVRFIASDDAMIREGGGVALLEDDEVVLACEDRGIDVGGKEVGELRRRLEEWVVKTTPAAVEDGREAKEVAQKEAEEKVRSMLLGLDGES